MASSEPGGGSQGTAKVLLLFAVLAILAAAMAALAALGIGAAAGRFLPAAPLPCPGQPLEPAALGGWSVDVYNASGAEGLAAETAAVLQGRGVAVGKVGNQPAPAVKVPAGAQFPEVVIAAPKSGYAQAAALQELFPESVFMPVDDDATGLRIYLTKPVVTTHTAATDSGAGGAQSTTKLRCVA